MGNIQFDEVYNGSSVEKICNTLSRSLRWEIGDSIKILIAADEISRSERRVVSRNAKREKTTSRFCCCRSRMLMNFWDKQATLMKMLVNSASNGRGSIVLSSWWLDTGPFTPCRTSRVEFLAQREAYAYIREFQWLSAVPSGAPVVLFHNGYRFPWTVSFRTLSTRRTCALHSPDLLDRMFFSHRSNS